MGFRFRKSVNIGPVRLNASKSGFGWSVGMPGARYTKMANGRNRVTASIPGTGISWVEESKKQPDVVPVKQKVSKKRKKKLKGWEKFCSDLWEVICFFAWAAWVIVCVVFIISLFSDNKGGK